ncbi:MAG: NUDIX domain-containing protein [Anaerolineae bacterium]|nr:NUDIX domain-containing protein [Anaerolineae bacterium]
MVGRFVAGIGALIWAPSRAKYLLVRRSSQKDFAPGVWECVTGRVDQGESYQDALHREVAEELGVAVTTDFILGTTHFYRGAAMPENELLGVVYHCSVAAPDDVRLSPEHSELQWATFEEAQALLSDSEHPSEVWLLRLLQRAERLHTGDVGATVAHNRSEGLELG